MPLPEATLSLGPLTQAGSTEPIKPKVAMLVRLSSATIDALTSVMNEKEKVSVDLGSTPGIHIDGTFYPMRMQKEETPHEIYLRIPRSNNSLKLYANVAEKLFIEHNEIGDDLKDKIRGITLEVAKQRDDRKTKFIPDPPIQYNKVSKKKKDPASALRNAIRPSDQAKLNASISSARVPSPAPQPSTKLSSTSASSSSGLFNRLIRCMAMRERTRDTIVKLVSGDDPSIRRDILELMEEVGEPKSPLKKGEDAGSKMWCLKAESWLHVRMDWPGLTTQDRLHLSRTGRVKLASLGYSAKDPEWSPFVYRPTDIEKTTATSSGDARQREKPDLPVKTGISSSEVKKPKPKADPNVEIPRKDESLKVTPRVTTIKTKDTASIPTTRKVPGSGFRAGKSGAQDASGVTEGSSHRLEKDNKPPRHSLPPKTMAASQMSRKEKMTGVTTTAQRIKKRESDAGFGSESERDRDIRSKQAVKHEERHGAEAPILKRRQGPQDSYDSDASTNLPTAQKKRRTENGAAASSSSKDVRSRDLPLPKKPDIAPPPRQKPRKEPTPPPLAAPLPKMSKKANGSSRLSTTGDMNKTPLPESISSAHSPHESRGRSEGKVSGKRRRGSPIYTSSEDEGESSKIRRITKAPSPTTETNHYKTSHSRRREHEREPQPLPTDHAGLRMRYTATYGQCMAALTTLLAQKSRIDSMLRNADTGSVTDSDGDGELMDVEDLKKLSGDYERMHEELEAIRQKFAEPVQ